MSSVTSVNPPSDYSRRIKNVRSTRGLTQARFAELIGVPFASVNRWENGQSRPNNLVHPGGIPDPIRSLFPLSR